MRDALSVYQLVRVNDTLDLATPGPVYFGSSTAPDDTVSVQTPPDEDETVQHVVEIILAYYGVKKAAQMIAALMPGIPWQIFAAAFNISGGMKGHQAYPSLKMRDIAPNGDGSTTMKRAARREIFYRAAYILRAAERMETDVHGGKSIPDAIADEKKIFVLHEAARLGRLDSAGYVARAADRFGPMLGWYLDPLLNNEPECIAANGHNFDAREGTLIGLPGAVHPKCGCIAGPPWPGAGMVNDAIHASRAVIFEHPKKYGLQRKAS